MCDTNRKRERSVNFTTSEIRRLLKLVHKHKNIIESKKTDAVSWKDKDKIWDQVENEFNSSSGEYPRNKKNLKMKYDSLKKELKKKIARNNVELFKTGGGPAQIEILTPDEELLWSIISLSVTGLPARHDSDSKNTHIEANEIESSSQNEILDQQEQVEIIEETNVFGDCTKVSENELLNDNIETEQVEDRTERNTQNPASTSSKSSDTWAQWNPKSLKKRQNTFLETNAQKKDVIETGTSYVKLMTLKQNLIQEQINLVKKEIELRDIEIQRKIKMNELMVKSQELNIKIKEKQLNTMV